MDYRILGPLEVLDDGGGSLKLGKRKERALLTFLVMHANRTVSRDACIDALWPDGAPERADANLHTLIARLRRSLEPERKTGDPPTRLVRDNGGYRLVAAHHEIDARRFRQAADRGRGLLEAGDAPGARRHLVAALKEWRGAALGEFAYEAFADRAAEQLEELRVATREAELGARVVLGERNVVPDLEHFISEHPLREHGWAYLLVALYRGGRQTEALRRAESFRVTLAEVGLEPSPKARRVADAILAHDPGLDDPAFVLGSDETTSSGIEMRPTLPRWWQPSDHFVGRDRQLDVLRELWYRCKDGDVRAAVLVGEPGIGKSTLAVETAERALVGGATVLAGRCSANSPASYHAITEALGRLVDTMDDTEIAALGDQAPRLSRLLPMAEARLGSPLDLTPHEQEVDRFLLFEAVSSLIGRHARTAPMLMLVDDLQWADAGTLHLLDHLLRSDRTGRLLVMVTVRSEDLEADTSIRSFIDLWYRNAYALEVELDGLDAAEIRELALAGVLTQNGNSAAGDLDFVDELRSQTDGNPFFVLEMSRHLVGNSTEFPTLPETVQAIIRSRLERLLPEHRRVLQVAALQADRIDLDVLTTVYGDAATVAAAIDTAVAAGILVERSRTLLFRHDLVRTVLESEIGPAQRAAQHRQLGLAYLERAGDDPGSVVDQVASHFVVAAADGDARDAVRYSKMAGDRARRALAYANAADHYRAGIGAMGKARPVDGTVAIDLQVALLEAWQLMGDQETVPHYFTNHVVERLPHASIDQLRSLTGVCVHCALAVSADEVEAFDAGLGQIEARFEAEDLADEQDMALVSLARSLVDLRQGEGDVAMRRIDQVLADRDPSWSVDLQVLIVDTAIFVLGERRPISELVRTIEEVDAIVQARSSTSLEHRQVIDVVTRWAAMTTGDVERALDLDDRMADRATQLGMPRYLAGMSQRRASLSLVRGRVDEAEFQAGEAIRYRPDDEFGEGYLAQLAVIRHHQGRVDELTDALASTKFDGDPAWMVGRAWLLAEVDEPARARSLLDGFVDRIGHWDRNISWLGTLGVAVYAADTLQARDAVEPLRRALDPHRGRVALTGLNALIIGPVDLLLAMLSAVAGEVDETRHRIEAARPSLKMLDAAVLEARSSLVLAEVLQRTRGDSARDEVVDLACESKAIMEALGIRGSLRARIEGLPG